MTKKLKFVIISKKEVNNLEKENKKMYNNDTQQKTIRFEKDLIEEIENLARGTERDFSKQVKFMLRQYIKITKEK